MTALPHLEEVIENKQDTNSQVLEEVIENKFVTNLKVVFYFQELYLVILHPNHSIIQLKVPGPRYIPIGHSHFLVLKVLAKFIENLIIERHSLFSMHLLF